MMIIRSFLLALRISHTGFASGRVQILARGAPVSCRDALARSVPHIGEKSSWGITPPDDLRVGQALARAACAAATMFSTANLTSGHLRVFNPQSGLTQS
jgi:hypothetical protein